MTTRITYVVNVEIDFDGGGWNNKRPNRETTVAKNIVVIMEEIDTALAEEYGRDNKYVKWSVKLLEVNDEG